jgi:hypothetical protein
MSGVAEVADQCLRTTLIVRHHQAKPLLFFFFIAWPAD